MKLRGGSLPLPVEVIEVRTIGPTLGAENIRRSLVAALSGLALVAVFMVFVYRLPGGVAVAALSLYALFNLAIYTLLPVTLTLPGIAGFILSIGMAVDAKQFRHLLSGQAGASGGGGHARRALSTAMTLPQLQPQCSTVMSTRTSRDAASPEEVLQAAA